MGPDMATGKTHVHKITNERVPVFLQYMALGFNDFDGEKTITQAISGIKIITSLCHINIRYNNTVDTLHPDYSKASPTHSNLT